VLVRVLDRLLITCSLGMVYWLELMNPSAMPYEVGVLIICSGDMCILGGRKYGSKPPDKPVLFERRPTQVGHPFGTKQALIGHQRVCTGFA
jgi:hypothetical protein